MKFSSQDKFHLSAAQGWLELGNHIEANTELGQVSPQLRVYPDVLELRWRIYSKAQKWPACLDIAEALIKVAPNRPEGWVDRSFTLHVLNRTQEAFDRLVPVVRRFPKVWTIPYNLACYCAQLGRLEECKEWFKKAMAVNEHTVKAAAIVEKRLCCASWGLLVVGLGWFSQWESSKFRVAGQRNFMKTFTGNLPGLFGITLLLSTLPVQAAQWHDPEDSPLYTISMRNAFADMAARDRMLPTPPQTPAGVQPDAIFVVEGKQWHMLPADARDPRPGPKAVTMSYPTCDTTCTGATCNGGSTCIGSSTCLYMPTCPGSGQPTCGLATCQGYPTCGTSPTCSINDHTCGGMPTCSGATCSATCYGNITCFNTCGVGNCSPPLITGVNVPGPGQFQFSFVANGFQVTYHVLYCTNLDAAQWTTVFSILANGTTVTFTHTNNAPQAYYRLSIQGS